MGLGVSVLRFVYPIPILSPFPYSVLKLCRVFFIVCFSVFFYYRVLQRSSISTNIKVGMFIKNPWCVCAARVTVLWVCMCSCLSFYHKV